MEAYFLRGKLPWQGFKDYDGGGKEQAVMRKKMAMSGKELINGLPNEFALRDQDLPNYENLRVMFWQLAEEETIEDDNVYDWTERWVRENISATDIE